jgi:hypothetical protein
MFDLDGLILENPSGRRKKKIKAQAGLKAMVANPKGETPAPSTRNTDVATNVTGMMGYSQPVENPANQGSNPIEGMMRSQFYNNPQPTPENTTPMPNAPMRRNTPTTPPANLTEGMYGKKDETYYMGRVPAKELDVNKYGTDPMTVMNELQAKVDANPYDRTSVRQLQNFIAQNAKGDKEILDILDTTSAYKGKAGTTYDGVYGKGTKTAYNMLMQKMQSTMPTQQELGAELESINQTPDVEDDKYKQQDLDLEVELAERARANNKPVVYTQEQFDDVKRKLGVEPLMVSEEAFDAYMKKRRR